MPHKAPAEVHEMMRKARLQKQREESGNGGKPEYDVWGDPSVTNVTTFTDVTNVTEFTDVTSIHKHSQTSQNYSQTPKTFTNSYNPMNYFGILSTWLESCEEEFKVSEVASELGWRSNPKHYAGLRKAVQIAVEKGILARARKERGCYRKVLSTYKELNIEEPTIEEFPLVLPLGLHRLSETNPKEILLIAGETNAGKTSVIFNLIWQNIFHLKEIKKLREKTNPDPTKIGIRHFTSEMGATSIKKKLLDFGPSFPLATFSKYVTSIEWHTGSQDHIDPSGLNCIDYLEPPGGDYVLMSPTITEIYNKLTTGFCIIAIQKRVGTDFGRGGEGTLEKPRLAISLSENKERGYFTAKITKAKVPRGGTNINGLEIDFLIEGGVRIVELSDWGYPNQHEVRRKKTNFKNEWMGHGRKEAE